MAVGQGGSAFILTSFGGDKIKFLFGGKERMKGKGKEKRGILLLNVETPKGINRVNTDLTKEKVSEGFSPSPSFPPSNMSCFSFFH